MKLYSAWYCPFAQRAWLTLLHKKIAFEYIETDPYVKTDNWLNVSRQYGQVPVVVTSDEQSIVDSTRIMEFLDLTNPQFTPLYSRLPSEHAEQKYWIDFSSKKIIPYFYRFLKNTDTQNIRQDAKQHMLEGIQEFVQAMAQKGCFFSGNTVGAVDIAFIPFAYRINKLLRYYRHFELPVEGAIWQRYHDWYRCNVEDSIFQETSTKQFDYEKRLIDFYLIYSQGGGQADVGDIH